MRILLCYCNAIAIFSLITNEGLKVKETDPQNHSPSTTTVNKVDKQYLSFYSLSKQSNIFKFKFKINRSLGYEKYHHLVILVLI